MGRKRRGRDTLETCANCGRSVPRDKAVQDVKRVRYDTDLKGDDNIVHTEFRTVYYCISCAKHGKIFEKKKEQARRKREREMYG
ncbi:40S ribosomal protein S26 [Candidatus Micrarchaeota archaeon]|nr:40S ribosomal protein S26 [Candidatus Micrarchaeota archaeon]MBU1166054.1 40S ribosomal protein S26 [Candidatus Micrarchaeota archaeon]MBU1886883.1 40S ribosomal protein S26 [Candidatus Micrarchaeota archaeon]